MSNPSDSEYNYAKQRTILDQLKGMGRIRILVADDEPAILSILNVLVKEIGFQLTTAADGDAVIQELNAQWPDVIITDLAMPGTSGLDLVRRIQSLQNEKGLSVPLIVMTNSDTRTECLEAGADGFLRKPVVADRLFAMLHSMLS